MRKSEGQGPQSFSNSAVKILRGIEGVGVDLFRFAFYPEGEAMKNFNSPSNQDYFLTKFSHQAAFKDGSALVILEDFATSVFPGDLDKVQAYIQRHFAIASAGLKPKHFTDFKSDCFRVRESASNDWRWYEIRSRLLSDERGLVLAEGVFTDVTELILADLTDPLTSLLSPNGMKRQLNDLLSQSVQAVDVALACLVVDGFDEYEAGFGIQSANSILTELASELSRLLPSGSFASISRRGAFMVCFSVDTQHLDGTTLVSFVVDLFKGITADLCQYLRSLTGLTTLSSMSVGISVLDSVRRVDADADRLMQESTAAAYLSSRSKSTKISVYSRDVATLIQETYRLQEMMQQSIEKREMRLLYQPQCNYEGKVIGAEALIRFPGLPGPDVLIPMAEKTGQIVAIGDFVMKQCIRDMMVFKSHGLRRLGFNVSPAQFASDELQHDFLTSIIAEIDNAGMALSDFEIEMTETSVFASEGFARQGFFELAESGFCLALDDFGAGYSSLSFLRNFPVGKVKIDGSFVENIVGSYADQVLVKGVSSICQSLGLQLLAECVEDAVQADTLQRLGICSFQGYHYSRPLSATDFIAYMQDRSVSSLP